MTFSLANMFQSVTRKFRRSDMSALEAGVKAPDFTLPTMSGDSFSLSGALQRGPVLLVFYKISCPVCQFALPYAERLFQAAKGKQATVVAISQDDRKSTAAFMNEYRLTLPTALDDTKTYPVSNAYGLTNVPTFFLVNRSGEIEISSVGWMREEVERMYEALMSEPHPAPFFRPEERVPELKFG
jgi:peroxiredoxin